MERTWGDSIYLAMRRDLVRDEIIHWEISRTYYSGAVGPRDERKYHHYVVGSGSFATSGPVRDVRLLISELAGQLDVHAQHQGAAVYPGRERSGLTHTPDPLYLRGTPPAGTPTTPQTDSNPAEADQPPLPLEVSEHLPADGTVDPEPA